MKNFNKLTYWMIDYRRKTLERKCYDSRERTGGTLMVLGDHIRDNRWLTTKNCSIIFSNIFKIFFFETFLFVVPLYMMALVGSIHIPKMHSVKMYSLGSAQKRNVKNMALRNIFWKNIFPSILLYRVVLMILSNFYYRIHHKITLPS